jgi:hypothetical protein
VHKSNKFMNAKDETSDDYVAYMLYGGHNGRVWSDEICNKLDEIDNKQLSYFSEKVTFPYEKLKDINPALAGIEPPITLEQANAIARQADSIGADKGGWGIAIDHFKKSHKVEDGHWVKKENMSMEDEKEVKEEEMAVETPEDEKKEAEEEKKEQEEEKQEEKEESKEEMSLDAYADVAAMLAMLVDETEAYTALAQEFSAEGKKDFAKMCNALYAKMCKMAENEKAYMAENTELKKFKADFEAKQFEAEVNYTMKEICESVEMPKDEQMALVDESKKFSLDTIDAWKNLAKSKAFSFAVKGKKVENETPKYALPWGAKSDVKKSLWE